MVDNYNFTWFRVKPPTKVSMKEKKRNVHCTVHLFTIEKKIFPQSTYFPAKIDLVVKLQWSCVRPVTVTLSSVGFSNSVLWAIFSFSFPEASLSSLAYSMLPLHFARRLIFIQVQAKVRGRINCLKAMIAKLGNFSLGKLWAKQTLCYCVCEVRTTRQTEHLGLYANVWTQKPMESLHICVCHVNYWGFPQKLEFLYNNNQSLLGWCSKSLLN